MALSFDSTNRLQMKMQRRRVTITPVTLDNAYPANGWAITADNLGLGRIDALVVLNSGSANYEWVPSTSKLKAYYGDYSNAADGLFIEVAVGDTAILDGKVIYVLAWGI